MYKWKDVYLCPLVDSEKGIPGRGHCISRKEGSGRAGGWVTRWHKHGARLTELARPREARSLGAQLAMTEPELDPELEGNGVGKLNGVNQRGGVIIFAFEKYH